MQCKWGCIPLEIFVHKICVVIDHRRLVVFYQYEKECISLLDSLIYYARGWKVHFGLPQVLWWAFPSIHKLCWHLWTHQTTVRLSCLSTRENQPDSYSLSFLLLSHRCRSRRSQLGTHLQFGPGWLNQYLFLVVFSYRSSDPWRKLNKVVIFILNQI